MWFIVLSYYSVKIFPFIVSIPMPLTLSPCQNSHGRFNRYTFIHFIFATLTEIGFPGAFILFLFLLPSLYFTVFLSFYHHCICQLLRSSRDSNATRSFPAIFLELPVFQLLCFSKCPRVPRTIPKPPQS